MHLNIQCVRENIEHWKRHKTFINAIRNGDSGLDIPCPEDVTVPGGALGFPINLGIKCETHTPFFLLPRSSISKTTIRMANSIGLIDRSYRGEIIAKVDNFSSTEFKIEKGSMVFQIVSFDGNTPTYSLVEGVNTTERGEGGFGSTTPSAEQTPVSDKESAPSSESSG